jgi:intracellular septation protein
MQLAIEFAPWVIFGLVYKFAGGLYPATAALMVAIALPLAYGWLRERKIKRMHLLLAVLVWLFGTATLVLHDVRFLQWKASVYYWLCGIALIGSTFIGKQSLLERLLGKTLSEGQMSLPARTWRNYTLVTGAAYLVFGLANIWVALNRPEAQWVTFKVWILTPFAIVTTGGLLFLMLRGAVSTENAA